MMSSNVVSGDQARKGDEVNNQPSADKLCHFKVLIPCTVIGSIMGTSGRIIARLEEMFETRICVSRSYDLYPGTYDRVCLISGNVDAVLRMNDFLIEKVASIVGMSSRLPANADRRNSLARSSQVKIFVPQSSTAKIIGRGGCVIESIKSETKCFIQMSQSPVIGQLHERIITVNGSLENRKKACRMIFLLFADDTKVDFYKNISYSRMAHPIPNAFPAGPPFAFKKTKSGFRTRDHNDAAPRSSILQIEEACTSFLDSVRISLRNMSFQDAMIAEAINALRTLIHLGVLNLCFSIMINIEGATSRLANSGSPETNSAPTSSYVAAADSNSQILSPPCACSPDAPTVSEIANSLQHLRVTPVSPFRTVSPTMLLWDAVPTAISVPRPSSAEPAPRPAAAEFDGGYAQANVPFYLSASRLATGTVNIQNGIRYFQRPPELESSDEEASAMSVTPPTNDFFRF